MERWKVIEGFFTGEVIAEFDNPFEAMDYLVTLFERQYAAKGGKGRALDYVAKDCKSCEWRDIEYHIERS